jgi:hypothetical protein
MKVPSRVTSRPNSSSALHAGVASSRLEGTTRPGAILVAAASRVLRTLEQIVALPDALGEHACECGHPEMRHLPGGVFHCPACGSEVVPSRASSAHSTLVGNPRR